MSSGAACCSSEAPEDEGPRDLSDGSFCGIFGSIGSILGGIVGIAGKVAAIIPGVGPALSAGADAAHALVWPEQAAQIQQYAYQPVAAPAPQPGSTGFFGLSPNTLLLVGGGVALVYFMSRKRGR